MTTTRRPPPDSDGRWHLEKKVPISIVLALVIQGLSGIWFIQDIKRDVEVLKVAQTVQHERDQRQDVDTLAALSLIRDNLKDINAQMMAANANVNTKLDRLVESQRYVERREDPPLTLRKAR